MHYYNYKTLISISFSKNPRTQEPKNPRTQEDDIILYAFVLSQPLFLRFQPLSDMLTPEQLARGQDMATRCFESDFQDCE